MSRRGSYLGGSTIIRLRKPANPSIAIGKKKKSAVQTSNGTARGPKIRRANRAEYDWEIAQRLPKVLQNLHDFVESHRAKNTPIDRYRRALTYISILKEFDGEVSHRIRLYYLKSKELIAAG